MFPRTLQDVVKVEKRSSVDQGRDQRSFWKQGAPVSLNVPAPSYRHKHLAVRPSSSLHFFFSSLSDDQDVQMQTCVYMKVDAPAHPGHCTVQHDCGTLWYLQAHAYEQPSACPKRREHQISSINLVVEKFIKYMKIRGTTSVL